MAWRLFEWNGVIKNSEQVPMSANAAAGSRDWYGNMDYTYAGNASGKRHTRWVSRNIRR